MKRLLATIICILVFQGCNKEEEKTAHPIPQQYIDWFYFNSGSYWIYEKNDLSAPDTLAVDTTIFLIVNNPVPPYEYEEYMRISYKPNPFGFSFDHLSALSAISRNFTDSTQYPIYDIYYSEPGKDLIMKDSYGNVVGTSKLENIYENYTIGTNSFDSVMVVLISDLVNTKLVRYYLAKGVGTAQIESIENFDTTLWILDEWEVFN
jgi:hypothetical protein